ncbi:ammonium transporter [Ectothiorhodospira mobilis]|uniref:Ammonium transporter n=1 Tax=Ectothiorhodospira mobilis TaxID=195064 RepID=A0A1I4SEH8_ECTMO|nr:ammonium transporter [Ectothiorhodospira mobilis]SFM62886.1 ammonium transporter [Ectothiorhodospira mobilis]
MENQVIEIAYALDTFYFLVSGALVMWMAAGFTMLEAGLVRSKSTVEILTKNIALYSIACIMYMIIGYNIMYGGGINSLIPSFWPVLSSVDHSVEEVVASGGEVYYSSLSDFFFQVVFVATAMSIVSGAVAERMKLWAFLIFCVVLTGFIYPFQGFWSWGGGFLSNLGYSDYAGSGIVHLTGAVAALAGVLLLGARKGKYGPKGQINALPGANLPLATLGIFILWLGWFGFNGGSELKVSDVESANNVARVFTNTNLAAAGGVVASLITSRLLFGKTDLTMGLNGALAGLVAITAEPLMPHPLLATLIGFIGGVLVVFSIVLLDKMRIDDPAGAISAHGTVGIWGVFAVLLSNPDATFLAQLAGVVSIFTFVFVLSLLFWLLLKVTMGIRVSEEDEMSGVDIAECGLEAYPEFTATRK